VAKYPTITQLRGYKVPRRGHRVPPPEVLDDEHHAPVVQREKPTGEDVVNWIQKFCRIPEGKKVGQLVKLEAWQKKEIRRIYDNPHGTRRAILSFPRKNAKTSLSAFLLLNHLCGKSYVLNSQLYSTAQSRDQAGVIFSLAAKVVRMSPELREVITIRDSAKELLCVELGTKYRALSAEASTAFGLSPSFIVHDELGQVRGPRSTLYEALETATGAQEDPLSLVISTQAPTDSDLLSILIDDALAGNDPRTIVSLYTAPKEANPFLKSTIKKANPAFGTFLNEKEVMAMAHDAKRMPAREAEYRNLVLNQRVETNNPFVTQSVWETCGAPAAPLDGLVVYGGLDLSSVADLTALVLIGKHERIWQVHPTFWLPEYGLREKAKKDRVPYDLWQEQDFLKTTDGNTVSYEYVAQHLFEVCNQYNVRKIGFDRWNMKHLKPWLAQAGFSEQRIEDIFVEFGQGVQSMSPALRDLEGAIKEKQLAHGNHPVLAMCAGCAVVVSKDDATRKLSKNKSTGRIDGLVALTMAMGVAGQFAEDVDAGTLIF
jgi:phage terminase large subunit-like protein